MTLKFITRDKDGRIKSAWNPICTGDYCDDVRNGKALAEDAVAFLCRTNDVPTFNRVIRDVGRAKQGGVEIGFLSRIASMLKKLRLEALSLTSILLCEFDQIVILTGVF